MATADVSTFSAISNVLKHRYLGPIRNQFPRNRVLEEILNHNREDVSGDEAHIPLRLAGNPAIGFRSDYADLPAPGRQKTEKTIVKMTYLYGRCAFTGPAIAATRDNAGAFAKVMDDEMKNLIEDLRVVSNSYNYGDGSGAIARVTAVAGNVITVDRWNKLFTVGRYLDTYTDKTWATKHLDSSDITAVDKLNLQFTVRAAGTTAVNDYVVLEDSAGICQMGLLGIADDGDFLTTHQGISRATYPIWNGRVFDNAGTARTISESTIVDAVSILEEDSVKVDLILGTIFQRNDLIKQLQSQRQFVNPNKKLKGGIRALEICDTDFVWDADCPPGYCFLGDTSMLSFYEQAQLDWMQRDGSILARIDGKDAYEATLFMYRELGSSRNNAWGRIEDLNENRPAGQ